MAFFPSEQQIRLYEGGSYTYQSDLNSRTDIYAATHEAQLAVPNAQFLLLDSSMFAASGITNISAGPATTASGGLVAAELAGAVGTAATTTQAGGLGTIANMVQLLDENDDPLRTTTGNQIFGLIQRGNGVADGTAIGAATAENVQLSFATYLDNAFTLVNPGTDSDATNFRFQANARYRDRDRPADFKVGSPVLADVVGSVSSVAKEAHYTITTAPSAVGSVLTIDTGAMTLGGANTQAGLNGDADFLLPATAADFNNRSEVQILRGGVPLFKGTSATWQSTTTVELTDFIPLVGEVITVRVLSSYA